MDEPLQNTRNPKRGIVLIATLISLMLLMALMISLQSRSLAATKVLTRLSAKTQAEMTRDSLREFTRPLVGEAMINFQGDTALKLNGSPLSLTYRGSDYQVVTQDPGGLIDLWRTPPRTAEVLLSADQIALRSAMAAVGSAEMPLRQIAARAGLAKVPVWLTDRARKRRLNLASLSRQFEPAHAQSLGRQGERRQPKAASVTIQKVSGNPSIFNGAQP